MKQINAFVMPFEVQFLRVFANLKTASNTADETQVHDWNGMIYFSILYPINIILLSDIFVLNFLFTSFPSYIR